jgi:hypothetical protein
MAFINFAPTRAAESSQASRSVNNASSVRHQGTWRRTALEAVGTFLILAGIAIGILALRFALVLVHGIMR